MIDKPLVTFGVKLYNQRQFVESALRGAFAQTYQPLEIVISDDGSSDGSFELASQLVEQYRAGGGEHTVLLHRNERNIGNVGNFETICRLAHGELVIQADGDDVSFPERTEKIVDAWLKAGKLPAAIISGAFSVDKDGNIFNRISAYDRDEKLAAGAFMAWRPSVVLDYPTCVYPRCVDDAIMVIRAVRYGPLLRIDEPLVYYRVGCGCSSSLVAGEAMRKCITLVRQCYQQWDLDLQVIQGKTSPVDELRMRLLVSDIKRHWDNLAEKYKLRPISRFAQMRQAVSQILREGWAFLRAIMPTKLTSFVSSVRDRGRHKARVALYSEYQTACDRMLGTVR